MSHRTWVHQVCRVRGRVTLIETLITAGAIAVLVTFVFGAGAHINAFEGPVAFPSLGRYYAVWPSLKADSPCDLLLQLRSVQGAKQYWVYTFPNGDLYFYPVDVPFPTCP